MLLSNALLFQENRLGSAGLFLAIDAFDATRSTKTYMKHACTQLPTFRRFGQSLRPGAPLGIYLATAVVKTSKEKENCPLTESIVAMLRRSAQNVEWTSRSPSGCAATLNRIHAALLRRWRERATPAAAAQTNQVSHVAR